MAQRKPYNPNTAYGRRKLREQYQINYTNKTPEEKREHDKSVWWMQFVWFIIAMIICLIVISLGGKIN